MRSFLAFSILAFLSCGPGPVTDVDNTPNEIPWENIAPSLIVASPGELSVGEEIVVHGEDFIDSQHGSLILVFRGTFFDDEGASYPVDLQVTPKRINNIKLSWKLWPNIVFHPNGDHLGRFTGEILVINVGKDGSQKTSAPLPIQIGIKPSLIARMARPINSQCQPVILETLGDKGFIFNVEAIGLRRGTQSNPLTFYWTFMSEAWKISFGNNIFWMKPPSDPSQLDPNAFLPQNGPITIIDIVEDGRNSILSEPNQSWLEKTLIVKIIQQGVDDLLGRAPLKKLRTMPISYSGEDATAPMSRGASVGVVAVDSSGKTASVIIPVEVFPAAVVYYDGNMNPIERFAAELVSECFPGGDIGRSISYREDKSKSYARDVGLNMNASGAINLGLPSNPFALGVNFSAGFGIDVRASVSSSESQSMDISAQVLPGEYAASYRQVTKYHRVGNLIGYNECGQHLDYGQVYVIDWKFGYDIGKGSSCPPPTNLPPAQKYQQ